METILLLNSSTLLTLMIILMPMILPLMTPLKTSTSSITTTVKTAFLTSLIPMTTFIYSGTESIISNWEWKFIMNFKIPLSFKMDQYSLIFLPIALAITWSML